MDNIRIAKQLLHLAKTIIAEENGGSMYYEKPIEVSRIDEYGNVIDTITFTSEQFRQMSNGEPVKNLTSQQRQFIDDDANTIPQEEQESYIGASMKKATHETLMDIDEDGNEYKTDNIKFKVKCKNCGIQHDIIMTKDEFKRLVKGDYSFMNTQDYIWFKTEMCQECAGNDASDKFKNDKKRREEIEDKAYVNKLFGLEGGSNHE